MKIEIKFKSIIDDEILEFIEKGILIKREHDKIIKFQEKSLNNNVLTTIEINSEVTIKRSNGIQMEQCFKEGEITKMKYCSDGVSMELDLYTKKIVREDNHLSIEYTTLLADTQQQHLIDIFYYKLINN